MYSTEGVCGVWSEELEAEKFLSVAVNQRNWSEIPEEKKRELATQFVSVGGKAELEYAYSAYSPVSQLFEIKAAAPAAAAHDQEQQRAFQLIAFELKSNYGNLNYSCIYRVRVHGIESSESDVQSFNAQSVSRR